MEIVSVLVLAKFVPFFGFWRIGPFGCHRALAPRADALLQDMVNRDIRIEVLES